MRDVGPVVQGNGTVNKRRESKRPGRIDRYQRSENSDDRLFDLSPEFSDRLAPAWEGRSPASPGVLRAFQVGNKCGVIRGRFLSDAAQPAVGRNEGTAATGVAANDGALPAIILA